MTRKEVALKLAEILGRMDDSDYSDHKLCILNVMGVPKLKSSDEAIPVAEVYIEPCVQQDPTFPRVEQSELSDLKQD